MSFNFFSDGMDGYGWLFMGSNFIYGEEAGQWLDTFIFYLLDQAIDSWPVDGEEEVADGDHDRVPDGAARALRAAPALLPLPLPLLTAGPHPAVHAQLGQVQDQPGGVWGWDGCGSQMSLSKL